MRTYILSAEMTKAFELALRGHDETDDSENPGVFLGLVNFTASLDSVLSKHLETATVFKGTSKTIQNEVLDIMFKIAQSDIQQEIKDTKFLAVISDDTTDVSNHLQNVVILRYLVSGQVVERFWSFCSMKQGDAVSIANVIDACLSRVLPNAEDKSKLIAQCYDGASVMSGLEGGRTGVITLLPKSGDPLEPKNKRPITLLNVDYKILAKALCNRLGTVMPDLVGSFQTCAVRGHSIQQNLWLVRDLVDYVMDRDLPCALVSLDQEKAFDMVDHGFLFKILQKFSLNPVFVKWTSLLYNSVYSRVIVNGLPSDPFRVHRGVRQGCPLSPLLYVLFSESLARAFQVEPLFRPFHIPGGAEVKCLQYADDVTCVISDLASFRALTGTLSNFQRATGARLNPAKTKGLRLGKWRSKKLPFAASWVDDAIKINGIWFGYGSPELLTWNEKVDLVEARLKDFADRHISLLGKVTVINRFIYPLLWYPGTVLAAPEGVLARLERAVFSFLWSRGTELVRRGVVYQDLRRGGLGLVHFPSKLLFLLTKCVYSAVDSRMPFAYFVRYWGGLSFRRFFASLFSNSEPHSWRPTGAYSQMRETLRIMSTVGNVSQSSARDLYRAVFDELVGQVQSNHFASGPEVWRVVHSRSLDYRRRDLLWRIAHDAIVTNLKRLRWRLGDGICPRTRCTKWESVSHVFWQCDYVALFWEWFQVLTDRLTLCNTWAVSQDYALKWGIYPFNPAVIPPETFAPKEGLVSRDRSVTLDQTEQATAQAGTSFSDPLDAVLYKYSTIGKATPRRKTRKQRWRAAGVAITETSILLKLKRVESDRSTSMQSNGCDQTEPILQRNRLVIESNGKPQTSTSDKNAPCVSQSDEEINDEVNCCICKKWAPPQLKTLPGVTFVKWAQCDVCKHWTHLRICSEIRDISDKDRFICPHCVEE
ncbi:hypothetical protein HOLleu_10367 [Holothuria leucospilota]|uniref:Reverse transcriptase domain-containing protein n=1 Tax=Holothuria leucospilota TaxID=206669 RepID=A0A9Q1HBN4_HOLLE|nr:hypothetical protein HOLleu_10367 [Holothuria leucospilota]